MPIMSLFPLTDAFSTYAEKCVFESAEEKLLKSVAKVPGILYVIIKPNRSAALLLNTKLVLHKSECNPSS